MPNDRNDDVPPDESDRESDLPESLEGEELDKDPTGGAMPSDTEVQAERPPEGLSPDD